MQLVLSATCIRRLMVSGCFRRTLIFIFSSLNTETFGLWSRRRWSFLFRFLCFPIMSVCSGRIVTVKPHAWMRRGLLFSAVAQRCYWWSAVSVMRARGTPHFTGAFFLLLVFSCSLLKLQTICLRQPFVYLFILFYFLFGWHALDCVSTLLFVVDECEENGLIMLTCW